MDMQNGHATNFIEALSDDIAKRSDDLSCPRERAFAELVLDFMGFSDDEDYRREHISDGAGDHGIDFWDVQDRSATVYQFKTVGLDSPSGSDGLLTPDHIGDVRRIVSRLRNIDDEPAEANGGAVRFLQALRSAVVRFQQDPANIERQFKVEIVIASNASQMTAQTKGELESLARECEGDATQLALTISIRTLLLAEIIEERWREQNSDWRDKSNNKREHVDIRVDGSIIDSAKSVVFFAHAIDLTDMYEQFGYQVFEPNVRCEIKRSKVNEAIRSSVSTHRGRKEFRHLNNGVTIICPSFQKVGKPVERMRILQPGVINGLQTIKSMYDSYQSLATRDKQDFIENCRVLVRLHQRDAVNDYRSLVTSTNNQNPMQARNLRANQGEQINYERLFADLGWFYERKEGAWAAFTSDSKLWGTLKNKRKSDFMNGRIVKSVDNEYLAQTWLAFLGYANEAVHERGAIFASAANSTRDYYDIVFLRRPLNHGSEHDFKLDIKEVLSDSVEGSPDPKLMLASFLMREFARQVVPAARQHREEAIKRLKIAGLPKDNQDQRLNDDTQYVEGLVRRAITYLFPEFVGYALFKAFGPDVHKMGRRILDNGSFLRLFKYADFKVIKEEMEGGSFQIKKDDILVVMWYLFGECLNKLMASSWRQNWMLAPNRTRFNHSPSTRRSLMRELDSIDEYIGETDLMRKWAIGMNEARGVSNYLKATLHE